MKHLMKLLFISGIAVLTGCTSLAEREKSPDKIDVTTKQGMSNPVPLTPLNN